MIELDRVTFAHQGGEPLLRDLSLAFPPGKITAIVGPNGSGKSTLLRLAGRLLQPDSGQVLLEGRDVNAMSRKGFARKVAMLHQGGVPAPVTARRAVLAGRFPHQRFGQGTSREDNRVVQRAMERTGCLHLAHQELAALSGGERQRVLLAMLLAQNTPVLLLDEPTTYLDIRAAHEAMALISSLNREEGKTIMLVLHDLALALECAHHLVVLERGAVVAQGPPEALARGEALPRVFGIRVREFREDGRIFRCFTPAQLVDKVDKLF